MKNIDPEKLRDMVRSILPSTNRWTPRQDKALRKRAHRRTVRIDIRHEDPEATAADLLRDVKVGDIVEWRRIDDKLNHFIRWCKALTEGMTAEEALAFVRGIVPKSVIGEHAYGHWEWYRKPRYRSYGPYLSVAEENRRSEASYRDSAICRLRRALDRDPSLHARLNADIKSHKPFDEPRRLLLGVHDVDAFVEAVKPPALYGGKRDPHKLEREAMLEHIARVEKGGRRAALGISGRHEPRGLPAARLRRLRPILRWCGSSLV